MKFFFRTFFETAVKNSRHSGQVILVNVDRSGGSLVHYLKAIGPFEGTCFMVNMNCKGQLLDKIKDLPLENFVSCATGKRKTSGNWLVFEHNCSYCTRLKS